MLPMPQRVRLFKEARDLIHREEETPLKVAWLAQAVGVSEGR